MELILTLVMAVFIFITYHKFVNVWYFSFKGFISEIIVILFISIFLCSILSSLLGTLLITIGSILGKVFTIILFIVKWGLIIGGILLIGLFIKSIFLKDKNLDNDLKIEKEEVNE